MILIFFGPPGAGKGTQAKFVARKLNIVHLSTGEILRNQLKKESDLIKNGFKIVIYANHLLRSAYPAMKINAEKILKNERTFELEKKISSIKEVISLIKE